MNISNNIVQGTGGGIYIETPSYPWTSYAEVHNCTITGNSATVNGAGVSILNARYVLLAHNILHNLYNTCIF